MDEGGELFFITGFDAVMEIITWKKLDILFSHCTMIAAMRPGFQQQAMADQLEIQLDPAYREKIIAFEGPAIGISSTDIRERVALGRSIRYLLPETVEQCIYKLGLYRDV
jgi:nicotinate-nucleotide adenylyltransferase